MKKDKLHCAQMLSLRTFWRGWMLACHYNGLHNKERTTELRRIQRLWLCEAFYLELIVREKETTNELPIETIKLIKERYNNPAMYM